MAKHRRVWFRELGSYHPFGVFGAEVIAWAARYALLHDINEITVANHGRLLVAAVEMEVANA